MHFAEVINSVNCREIKIQYNKSKLEVFFTTINETGKVLTLQRVSLNASNADFVCFL